jgi:ribosomal protein L40E
MARKKIGHVELQWTCPNCAGLNPGPEKLCGNCGGPQPKDVEFFQAERQELISDEGKIEQAELGANIHCPYCGSRNPADAEVCHQCGGDLIEGVKRESGRVVGAFKTGPVSYVSCPHCGAENTDTAKTCVQCGGTLTAESIEPGTTAPIKKPARNRIWIIAGIAAVLIVVCGVFFLLANRTSESTGMVQEVEWQRSVPVEALMPVEYKDWQDSIPAEGAILACTEEVRNVQNEPAPNSVEICGTPYTVDTGSGFGDVVQDCQYEVYATFCTYTLQEWSVVEAVVLTGDDYSPVWPEPTIEAEQRVGEDWEETYSIIFESGNEMYLYSTNDISLYQAAQIDSEWTLNINTFGTLVSIEAR